MVEFIWHASNGAEIVIDNYHAYGSGAPANTANWMIEYQDHFTFVNWGDQDRTITLHLRDHGTLTILVRDSVTGEVLEASYTTGLGENSGVFSIQVSAHRACTQREAGDAGLSAGGLFSRQRYSCSGNEIGQLHHGNLHTYLKCSKKRGATQ